MILSPSIVKFYWGLDSHFFFSKTKPSGGCKEVSCGISCINHYTSTYSMATTTNNPSNATTLPPVPMHEHFQDTSTCFTKMLQEDTSLRYFQLTSMRYFRLLQWDASLYFKTYFNLHPRRIHLLQEIRFS